MVEEAAKKKKVCISDPLRNWRFIVHVNALIFCKINAKFNAKKCKIYAKLSANYVKSTLNFTLNMENLRLIQR